MVGDELRDQRARAMGTRVFDALRARLSRAALTPVPHHADVHLRCLHSPAKAVDWPAFRRTFCRVKQWCRDLTPRESK